jgi:outer membrane protein TolC
MALSLDTLELTLAKLSYLQKIIAAKSALESENEILNNLAGQRIKVEPLAQFSFSGAEEDRFFEKDERLQSLKIRKNILKFKKELSASSYYPTIALNAAYKYGDPGADIIQREWMSYGVWGVGIHWNLFRWGADKKAIEAGDAAVRELEYHYQDVSEKIKSDFMKTKRELASLKAQLDVLRTALHIAGEKLHIIDSRYKQGMASAADYNDANLNLAETELKYKQFLSAVALKINELDYKSGKPLQQWRLEQ